MRFYVVMIFMLFCINLYAEDTEVKFYRPFVKVNHQGSLVIKEIKQGECWQQSSHIQREDAWRCQVGEKVYDPCFINPFGLKKQAFCKESPWVRENVQINLANDIEATQQVPLDVSTTYPWAVELATGEQCQAIDESENFDGLLIRYQCTNKSILFGHLQRCKSLWTMLQRQVNGQVDTAQVTKAWF